MADHATGKQIQSTVRADGTLKISLETVPTPEPESAEVVVQVQASPINPSDLGLLFGGADMTTARIEDGAVIADIPEAMMRAMARTGRPGPAGGQRGGGRRGRSR